MADSTRSISSMICDLVLPSRHCDSGLRSTSNSAMLISLGSVPSSGRPALEMTVFTSGMVLISARTRASSRMDSATDTLGGRGRLTQIDPSFSSGKNSLPSLGTSARLSASATPAAVSTSLRLASDHTSTGL